MADLTPADIALLEWARNLISRIEDARTKPLLRDAVNEVYTGPPGDRVPARDERPGFRRLDDLIRRLRDADVDAYLRSVA